MEAVRQVPKVAPPRPNGWASWALMAVLAAAGVGVTFWDAGEVALPQAEVAGELVTVGAPAAGRLASVAVVEGGEVTRGQAVARLDDDDRRMAVTRAEAELAAAEGGLKATRTGVSVQLSQLSSRIGQSRAGVQVAASTLSGAEARAAQARLDLDGLRRGLAAGGTAIQQVQTAETAVKTADAEVATARSRLAMAQEALRLAEAGAGEVAVTRAGLETGQAGIGKARAELAAAKLRLAEGNILAPAAGRVARVLVHAGEQVTVGQPICTVAAAGQVWVEALADEAVLDRLHEGAEARVRMTARPDVELEGRVTAIGAVLEHPTNGTTTLPPVARVRITLRSPEPWLRPGMSASVRVGR